MMATSPNEWLSDLLVRSAVIAAFTILSAHSCAFVMATSRVVNFAHLVSFTLGGYVAVSIANAGFFSSVAAAAVAGGAWSVATYALIASVRRRRSASVALLIVLTIALQVAGQNALALVWGDEVRRLAIPFLDTRLPIASGRVSGLDIATIAASLGIAAATALLFRRTRIGLQFRAAAADEELARLRGVRVGPLNAGFAALGGVVAATTGLLYAAAYGLSPFTGVGLFVAGLAVFLLVGVSPSGLVAGGFALTAVQVTIGWFFGAAWQTAAALVVLAGAMAVRRDR